MKLFTYFIIASVTAAGLTFAAPEEATLKAKETAAWQAYKDKNPDAFKKLVSDKARAVYADAINGLDEDLAAMQNADIKSFTINDYKVTPVGSDTAISTYTVTVQATVEGRDISGTHNVGSVWKQQGGEWKAIFHTDVPQVQTTSSSPSPSASPTLTP